ncbi:nuclear transport factor 2 family protein [Mycobacterium sp. 21AC1]|uniref:nuclear transport factor 2 family protein n=1 Tax=[Mycobacterium] appelbergii TaxID=2939269 RepID=UPI0029393348|nr:nuclear transport factor 2 family protein [Mycobacterium sp. 21AC1]MDV3124586.1 nuclear transport factor 2 family protein [Mycobacterium sp. 21AC1]
MTDDATWLETYYAAWDSGDAEAISAWFDDEVVLEDVPTGHIARGRAQARGFVDGALKLAPGASYEILAALVSGEQFAAEWVMQPAGLHGASVGTVRNGKIATNRDFWDASTMKT